MPFLFFLPKSVHNFLIDVGNIQIAEGKTWLVLRGLWALLKNLGCISGIELMGLRSGADAEVH